MTKEEDFEEKKNQLEQRMGVVEQGLVRCNHEGMEHRDRIFLARCFPLLFLDI